MIHRHGSAAERARHLGARSDDFLAAAGHLCVDRRETIAPRTLLLGVAVELRLKAYICLARGGTPETHDLFRLGRLAEHCGLALTGDQRHLLARLDRGRLDDPTEGGEGTPAGTEADEQSPAAELATTGQVRALCHAIDAQAPGPGP